MSRPWVRETAAPGARPNGPPAAMRRALSINDVPLPARLRRRWWHRWMVVVTFPNEEPGSVWRRVFPLGYHTFYREAMRGAENVRRHAEATRSNWEQPYPDEEFSVRRL